MHQQAYVQWQAFPLIPYQRHCSVRALLYTYAAPHALLPIKNIFITFYGESTERTGISASTAPIAKILIRMGHVA